MKDFQWGDAVRGLAAFGAATGQIARKWPKTGFPKRALFGITQLRSHLGESPHPHSFKCGGPRAKGAEREYYEITPSSSLADTVAFVQRKGNVPRLVALRMVVKKMSVTLRQKL